MNVVVFLNVVMDWLIYISIANNHIRLIRNLNTDFVFVIIHNIYYTFCYIKQRNAMLRNTFWHQQRVWRLHCIIVLLCVCTIFGQCLHAECCNKRRLRFWTYLQSFWLCVNKICSTLKTVTFSENPATSSGHRC